MRRERLLKAKTNQEMEKGEETRKRRIPTKIITE
jgi:hypothetical protein